MFRRYNLYKKFTQIYMFRRYNLYKKLFFTRFLKSVDKITNLDALRKIQGPIFKHNLTISRSIIKNKR